MSETKENQLLDLVNSSGYPLQIGIEEMVNQSKQSHHWAIFREHYWSNPVSSGEGYVDLVLSRDNVRMAVECKRVFGKDWIFLLTKQREFKVDRTKALCSQIQVTDSYYEWAEKEHTPESSESSFCIMGKEKDRPTLEALSSDLLMALESMVLEERKIILSHLTTGSNYIIYLPIIVTTADLYRCLVNPGDVNIEDGTVSPQSKFEKVDFIRFRKGLSTANLDSRKLEEVHDLREANKANERTVFVIHASKFVDFLCRFAS